MQHSRNFSSAFEEKKVCMVCVCVCVHLEDSGKREKRALGKMEVENGEVILENRIAEKGRKKVISESHGFL